MGKSGDDARLVPEKRDLTYLYISAFYRFIEMAVNREETLTPYFTCENQMTRLCLFLQNKMKNENENLTPTYLRKSEDEALLVPPSRVTAQILKKSDF
jgi:hypothetical protein